MSITELCPKCDAPMALRKAYRGPNKGKHFLGCTKYPKCKRTRPYNGPAPVRKWVEGPQNVDLDAETRARIKRVLPKLTIREQKILSIRFGIGDKPHTLEETGKRLNISRERVRQLINKVMRKVNYPTTKKSGIKNGK
jgi:RNA polymerase sigma factor (sigma-70 family)